MERQVVILIADDNQAVRDSLAKVFRKEGYRVLLASEGYCALETLRHKAVDVALIDLKMPGLDGLSVIKAGREISPHSQFIVITGYGTIEKAVTAMKIGACDFISKPFKRMAILDSVRRALRSQCLRPSSQGSISTRIVGKSSAIKEVLEFARKVARSSATVLIEGETGTGKELVAETIHELSPRCNEPLVKVNCSALPETLLEAELFGHERGAFTGATRQRAGRLEVAHRGTFFIDEVSQIPLHIQTKLLRVMDEKRFERLGSNRTLTIDTRIIAATNTPLKPLVEEGKFRDDLFWRLNVIRITIPPLRERKEDIPLLVDHFIAFYSEKNSKQVLGISREALDRLLQYDFPGNVRELENIIERAVVLCSGKVIMLEDLPPELGMTRVSCVPIPIGTSMKDAEKRLIEETLRYTNGDKSAAAALLGIARRTIYRKLSNKD